MAFDGEHLTPFDDELLADLREAHPVIGGAGLVTPTPAGPARRRRGHPRRGVGLAMGVFVVFVAAVAGMSVVSRPPSDDQAKVDSRPGPNPDVDGNPTEINAAAGRQVNAALSRTAAASSFRVHYRLESKAGPRTPATHCDYQPVYSDRSEGYQCGENRVASLTTGDGRITVSPKAMSVTADIDKDIKLAVSLRLIGDQVWQIFGTDPNPVAGVPGPGAPQGLSRFAGTVRSTIGERTGSLAVIRMASSNAYLALEEPSIIGATPAGTSTQDGVPVTDYDIDVDLGRLEDELGLTADEVTTIHSALDGLRNQGYQSTRARVSIDGDGFIRHLLSTSTFQDSGVVEFDATYSDFACGSTPATSADGPTDGTGLCLPPGATAPTTAPPGAADANGSVAPAVSTTTPPALAPATAPAAGPDPSTPATASPSIAPDPASDWTAGG